jgi:hypothetical protein
VTFHVPRIVRNVLAIRVNKLLQGLSRPRGFASSCTP